MDSIVVENVCRLCLAEFRQFSEPLSNWIEDVLIIFGLELCLDDGLPQQICMKCTHSLTIVSKLRETFYDADTFLKTNHKADIKPDLKSGEFGYLALNNDANELNKTADLNRNINNPKYAIKREESSDVKCNYPILNDSAAPTDTSILNRRFVFIAETRVMLEKLPEHVSNTSLIYCSICLLAFTDRERFNIHLNLNIHNINRCGFCHVKYENIVQLWEHIDSTHIDDILANAANDKTEIQNYHQLQNVKEEIQILNVQTYIPDKRRKYTSKMSDAQRLRKTEYKRKQRANMSEEQRNKVLEYGRKKRANITEEERKKRSEYRRIRYMNMTEEQRRKQTEYLQKKNASMTEEQRKYRLDYKRKWRANMSKEQRLKEQEYARQWYANNNTEKRRKERSQNEVKRRSNKAKEQQKNENGV